MDRGAITLKTLLSPPDKLGLQHCFGVSNTGCPWGAGQGVCGVVFASGFEPPWLSGWLLLIFCPTMCLAPSCLPLPQPPPLSPPLLGMEIKRLQDRGCS